jgi:hypothetical protein
LVAHFGGCNPGDPTHALTRDAVSARRAMRIRRSRSTPGGMALASSRRRIDGAAAVGKVDLHHAAPFREKAGAQRAFSVTDSCHKVRAVMAGSYTCRARRDGALVNTADKEIARGRRRDRPRECTAKALGAGEYKAVQAGKPTRCIKSMPRRWFLGGDQSPRGATMPGIVRTLTSGVLG